MPSVYFSTFPGGGKCFFRQEKQGKEKSGKPPGALPQAEIQLPRDEKSGEPELTAF